MTHPLGTLWRGNIEGTPWKRHHLVNSLEGSTKWENYEGSLCSGTPGGDPR